MNPGYGWCWWPGSVFSSYVWNPALVGFFGWGGGFGIGFGGLGWVALAPFEFFHPWWGDGFGYGGFGRGGYGNYTNINIRNTNITNITNIYRNAGVKGGAITCAGKAFGRGKAGYGRATQAQLHNASLIRGQLPVSATQASRQFSNRQATPNPRLASVANRHFYQGPQLARSARTSGTQQQLRTHTQAGSMAGGNAARTGQPGFNTRLNSAQRGQASTMARGSAPTPDAGPRGAPGEGASGEAPGAEAGGAPAGAENARETRRGRGGSA